MSARPQAKVSATELDLLRDVEAAARVVLDDSALPSTDSMVDLEIILDRLLRLRGEAAAPTIPPPPPAANVHDFAEAVAKKGARR